MTLVHSQSHSVVCSLCKISNKRTINENYEKCTQTVVCVLVCECAICAHTKSVPTFRRAFTFLLGVHTANKYLATKCRENSLQCVQQPTTRISALKFIRFFFLSFFRAKDFHFGFVFFRCIIRVFSFRFSWIVSSFVCSFNTMKIHHAFKRQWAVKLVKAILCDFFSTYSAPS